MASTDAPLAPEALEARIDRLEAKLDALTDGLAALTHASQRATVVADAAGDTAAWAWRQAEARGIDPIERGMLGIELAEQLTDPVRLALVRKLIARTDALEAAVAALDGVDADDLARVLKASTALLSNPDLRTLLDHAPTALAVAGPATTALAETRKGGWQPAGPIAALTAIFDPAVQKAVGFTIAIARRFGSSI